MIESNITETSSTVASHYDDLDAFYREVWGLHVHHGFWEKGSEDKDEATKNLITFMLKDVHLTNRDRVCDIGCGYGETARFLADKYGVHVTGLSVSENQIKVGKTLSDSNLVHLIQRDWMENNLPSSHFDLAYSIESSEHMPDLRKFFSEASRVLKPGGTLKICAWLSTEDPAPWELKHLLKPICTEGRLHLSHQEEYFDLMKETGFGDIYYEDITDKVKRTWTLCIKRSAEKFLTDSKYLKFMLQNPSKNKKFLMSLFRIRLAYETKSMRYGVFTAKKSV